MRIKDVLPLYLKLYICLLFTIEIKSFAADFNPIVNFQSVYLGRQNFIANTQRSKNGGTPRQDVLNLSSGRSWSMTGYTIGNASGPVRSIYSASSMRAPSLNSSGATTGTGINTPGSGASSGLNFSFASPTTGSSKPISAFGVEVYWWGMLNVANQTLYADITSKSPTQTKTVPIAIVSNTSQLPELCANKSWGFLSIIDPDGSASITNIKIYGSANDPTGFGIGGSVFLYPIPSNEPAPLSIPGLSSAQVAALSTPARIESFLNLSPSERLEAAHGALGDTFLLSTTAHDDTFTIMEIVDSIIEEGLATSCSKNSGTHNSLHNSYKKSSLMAFNVLYPEYNRDFSLNASLLTQDHATGMMPKSILPLHAQKHLDLWIQSFGNIRKNKSFFSSSEGILMGLDWHINTSFTLGMMGGWGQQKMEFTRKMGEKRTNSGYCGPYIQWRMHKDNTGLILQNVSTFSFNKHKDMRNMPLLAAVTWSQHASYGLANMSQISYTFRGPYCSFFTPFLGLAYSELHETTYTEKGSEAFRLHIPQHKISLIREEVGLKCKKAWISSNPEESIITFFQVSALFKHLGSTKSSFAPSFISGGDFSFFIDPSPFDLRTSTEKKVYATITTGLSAPLAHKWTLSFTVRSEFAKNDWSGKGFLEFRKSF